MDFHSAASTSNAGHVRWKTEVVTPLTLLQMILNISYHLSWVITGD